MLSDFVYQEGGGFVDAALQGDGVGTRRHVAQTFFDDGVGQHGGGGGTVASGVVGLRSGLTNQGYPGVFNVVFQFDFLRDGHPIVDDLRSAELLL